MFLPFFWATFFNQFLEKEWSEDYRVLCFGTSIDCVSDCFCHSCGCKLTKPWLLLRERECVCGWTLLLWWGGTPQDQRPDSFDILEVVSWPNSLAKWFVHNHFEAPLRFFVAHANIMQPHLGKTILRRDPLPLNHYVRWRWFKITWTFSKEMSAAKNQWAQTPKGTNCSEWDASFDKTTVMLSSAFMKGALQCCQMHDWQRCWMVLLNEKPAQRLVPKFTTFRCAYRKTFICPIPWDSTSQGIWISAPLPSSQLTWSDVAVIKSASPTQLCARKISSSGYVLA